VQALDDRLHVLEVSTKILFMLVNVVKVSRSNVIPDSSATGTGASFLDHSPVYHSSLMWISSPSSSHLTDVQFFQLL